VAQARAAGDEGDDLLQRLTGLLEFVRRFDRGVDLFVRGEPNAIARVFAVLERLDDRTVNRLWSLVDEVEPDELVTALGTLSRLPPSAVHRLVAVADSRPMRKLLGLS
jgi:hypothetical protein